MTLCCGHEIRGRLRSIKRLAKARKMSATSRVGRVMTRPSLRRRRDGSVSKRIGRDPHTPGREVEINHRVARVLMAEESLDNGQLGAVVEQMGSEGVAQRMRMDRLVDAGAHRAAAAGVPDGFVRDGVVRPIRVSARKHPAVASLQGTVVGAELLEQNRAERDVAGLVAFAVGDGSIMRSLSMCSGRMPHNSARRMPVEYRVIRMVR